MAASEWVPEDLAMTETVSAFSHRILKGFIDL